MTQIAEFGLCGCRIHPHRWLRTSSEVHAAGEREVRIFKGFRCRINCLTPRASPSTQSAIAEANLLPEEPDAVILHVESVGAPGEQSPGTTPAVIFPPALFAERTTAISLPAEPLAIDQRGFQVDLLSVPCGLGIHVGEYCVAVGLEEAIEIRVFGLGVVGQVADN